MPCCTMWIPVVVIAGTLDPSNERGRAWMGHMVERAVTAIDDLDLLALLPSSSSEEAWVLLGRGRRCCWGTISGGVDTRITASSRGSRPVGPRR